MQRTKRDGRIIKLVVSAGGSSIKIEPNEVLRGTTAPPVSMTLVKEAEDLFEMSVSFPIVPLPDLYGGKICAALDRQHPRDLFDVKVLLEKEGLTDDVRKGFIVFLCCHDRPMHELIKPNLKDLTAVYQSEFKGMTSDNVPLDSLYKARTDLIHEIHKALTEDERRFLVSLKSGNPEWKLLNVNGVESLSGIQWKLQNIQKMNADKRREQIAKLEKVLGL